MLKLQKKAAGILLVALAFAGAAEAGEVQPVRASEDLEIKKARVRYESDLETVVFEMTVSGRAGATVPTANGAVDGAPVLGYVFPTSLTPDQVGFDAAEGIVALAATSHPDFDDTPLWDEDGNGDPTNTSEGGVFHTHWVVLVEDDRVAGGLSVRATTENSTLPPTAPGMPIYLDSPGYSAVLQGNTLRIPVPAWRIRNLGGFQFDGVTAFMQVNASDPNRPMLGVYEVYSVASGDLSLPYRFELPQKAISKKR